MMTQGQPIEELKGIGEKTGKLYRKLGIETVEDLLHYYPRAYDPMEEPVSIGELQENQTGAVRTVLTKPADLLRFSGLQLVSAPVKDLTGTLTLTWYNMPYMRSQLKTGTPYIFRGRVVRKRGRLAMEQPEVFSEEDYSRLVHSMQPIYGQTRGLGNKAIAKAVSQALAHRKLEREFLPEDLRRRYELAEYNFAIEHIHFPKDEAELRFARKRLVYDEFFLFLLAVRRLKEKRQNVKSAYVMERHAMADGLKASLPYRLTAAQERTLGEVWSDLKSGAVMNRLIMRSLQAEQLEELLVYDQEDVDLLYGDLAAQADFQLLKRVVLDGCTMLEAAEEQGITVEACKKRVQRIRAYLKQKLADF